MKVEVHTKNQWRKPWHYFDFITLHTTNAIKDIGAFNVEIALLGFKVEGWNDCRFCNTGYSNQMHGMIDALIEGKSIHDYLETL